MTTLPISWIDLVLAGALVLANGAASVWLGLGLGRRLVVAAVRTVVQLLVLGLVLHWVFETDGPVFVVLILLAMSVLAGFEAVRRTTRRVRGLLPGSMAVMTLSSILVLLYGLRAVVGVEPWWAPRYAIPILGMILGNALNGVSLGLETVLEGFDRERRKIEVLLAHGATRSEASRDVVRRAVRTGTIPIVNSMAAAGLVSIPGMMTGQILSGEPPLSAARYQIFILFCIASAVALGTVGVVLVAARLVFDERERLRPERILRVGPERDG